MPYKIVVQICLIHFMILGKLSTILEISFIFLCLFYALYVLVHPIVQGRFGIYFNF